MTLTATAPAPALTPAKTVKDTSWKDGDKVRLDTSVRCDRCGAQAYIEAETLNGSLTFCSHHANALRPLMEAKGVLVSWYTETPRMAENRLKGSEN